MAVSLVEKLEQQTTTIEFSKGKLIGNCGCGCGGTAEVA
jgi:hypothetical protein